MSRENVEKREKLLRLTFTYETIHSEPRRQQEDRKLERK
jgi:hypothetical protein